MGFCTSALMKIQGSDRLSPKLRVSERFPYVRMGVSFTAMRVSLSGERRQSAGEGGMALTIFAWYQQSEFSGGGFCGKEL